MDCRIFLFGEAERGELCAPLHIRSLDELLDTLGHPPKESQGIPYAIQAMLYKNELIYYRIREEGYAFEDYMRGVRLLEKKAGMMNLSAICVPGVGDKKVIDSLSLLCKKHKSLLIFNEQDLYDYLTVSKY